MKTFYVTKRTYKPRKGRIFEMESKTQPGQSLSIRQILDRFARGMPVVGNASTPVYNGDKQIPDLSKMDFAEREDYIIQHRAKVEAMKKDISEMQRAQQEAIRKSKDTEHLHKDERSKKQPVQPADEIPKPDKH